MAVSTRRSTSVQLKDVLIFCTGFLTMIHQVTVFPYLLYGGAAVTLVIFAFLVQTHDMLSANTARYLLWYGLFTLLVLVSLLYTVNSINPEYVTKRVLVIFVLALIVAGCVTSQSDVLVLLDGLIAGSIAVAVTTLLHEGSKMGTSRMGGETVGSAVAFSGILLTGFLCAAWRAIYLWRGRLLCFAVALFSFVMIIYTGSRRALILSAVYLLLFAGLNPNVAKTRRSVSVLLALCAASAMFYFLMFDPALYNLVGWRLENLVESVDGSWSVDESMAERQVMRSYALQLFLERPLLGYGVHGFAYEFYFYYGKLLYSHSGFVEILSCYGLIGFALFYRVYLDFARRRRLLIRPVVPCQVLFLVYALVTLVADSFTIAFLTPYVIVMMTAGMNVIRFDSSRSKIEGHALAQ